MSLLGHNFLSVFWLIQVLDIALITFLVWLFLRALWNQPAMRVVIAIAIVWGISVLLNLIGFYSIGYITGKIASVTIFALIVIFSHELKVILARFGLYLSRIGFLDFRQHYAKKGVQVSIEAIVETCRYLKERNFGGLIVLIREDKDIRSDCQDAFVLDDLPVTAQFLQAFLTPSGPFHDGAIVIKEDVITMARAILPLSMPSEETRFYGTRHRAAKGLTEKTDAVVVLVSEESGTIRIAFDGKLTGPYSYETLKDKLERLMDMDRRED